MESDTWTRLRPFLLAALLLLVLGFLLHQYAARKLHAKEPPVIPSSIPYIGHVLGMIAYGGRYSKSIASKHRPIFTLPMPGSRMYIVTDPALAATVQKTKSLSFNPIIPQVTERILGLDRDTVNILSDNIGREAGPHGFYPEVHDLVYSTMTPGEQLDELTARAAGMFKKHLNDFAASLDCASMHDLLAWAQHMVTIATAEFLYGPENPIAMNPSLDAAFWDFDHGLGQLLAFAGLQPQITARKAYLGREAVVGGLHQYLDKGHFHSASPMIQHRIKIAQKYGMSPDGMARSELSFLFAGIVNTAITSFWCILHIFAQPDLLKAVREELEKSLVDPAADSSQIKFDLSNIPNDWPLLQSIYREVLRLGSDNSSNRLVLSDTLLADTYFLAKGSIVQISGAAMHIDPQIWGEDVNTFDPYRFMPNRVKAAGVHPAAFRAFGGGTTICPGRHFATREILYFVALVVMMFDIGSAHGGKMKIPAKKDDVLPVHILEPMEKVMARIKLREKT